MKDVASGGYAMEKPMFTVRAPRRSLGAAALVGIGVMAGIVDIICHQLLQWYHFFDRSTPVVGLLSDGLLHAAELMAIVAGFFLLLSLRRDRALVVSWAWAGFFIGMGGFQLFDGIVSHKVLGSHQIRYGGNILPYALVWASSALLLRCSGSGAGPN